LKSYFLKKFSYPHSDVATAAHSLDSLSHSGIEKLKRQLMHVIMQFVPHNTFDIYSSSIVFKYIFVERKLRSSGRALGSRSEGRGFDPHPMLDRSGVKAMPGLIPTPNSGSL